MRISEHEAMYCLGLSASLYSSTSVYPYLTIPDSTFLSLSLSFSVYHTLNTSTNNKIRQIYPSPNRIVPHTILL